MVKRGAKASISEDEESKLLNEGGSNNAEPAKKRLKTKSLYRQPTVNELNRLQETENLFNSNLFRLQIEEILQEVKLKEKHEKKIQTWFEGLKKHLENIPEDDTEYDLTEKALLKKLKVKLPIHKQLDKTKCVFKFHKFKNVELIGSYALGCPINSKLIVDIQITVPAETYTKNDSINYRYHKKRAAYLAYVASHLKSLETVEDLSYSFINGCQTQPVLDFKPVGKLGNHITARIHIACEAEAYKLHRFSPGRNNLREAWLLNKDNTENNSDVGPATPYYNSSVLSDITASANTDFLTATLNNSENLKQAVVLLKIWLRQRKLQVSGFVISMLVAYLVQTKRINNIMSSYQIIRNVWISLKTSQWDTTGITLHKDTDSPPLSEFSHFPVIFLDTTGYYNICWQMNSGTYAALKREAVLAVDMLDDGSANSFIPLFMTTVAPLLQYDYVLRFKDFKKLKQAVIDKSPLDSKLNYGIDDLPLVVKTLHSLLVKGLTYRADLVLPIVEADLSWPIGKAYEKVQDGYEERLSFGFILNQEHALDIVDKGPAANLPEAEEFRGFWGDKSELRRFQDGSITETCVWEGDTLSERRSIARQIVEYLFKMKYDIPPTDLFHILEQLNSLTTRKQYTREKRIESEESALAALQAADDLRRDLRGLTELPLDVSAVYGTSSVFSYCDPTPPLPSPPYNPWRRGGTCLVKDIEKDGVFQAPEFVPACETVVELGKFSVGTSSVFSYCDPTPPLPSPPYNPWRRGGTCLVKDIEKDGVFQAPEFVPACETVVELGKFSVGTSSVFSYCDPTPPLPSPPYNPWRRGGTCLVKDIEKDGVFQAPEFVPACETVVELGKFSVGTSSVFSYCDPTPPLPSPPYNPWRRGGTCLVKDIEKDGVFQAPEFVPACETVVELGKFSVGTSSVFSYCDPTPPLPSPPYNPWRRGGTCLVKDIEKDGVFQAPEFVPACETVVELGKFSVGTSSVFSYCDPTPPLPSPPYNPWRRGGTCLVKDIEKDGVFQAPEFVPACETVVELGKFSVGTSSVFSYCDPTPPLPSPPYNPWRRGGTCLVKDIEKDGVFQAPEFVPACETVVELGKFSVGTSSVFSYCDPTPPLPSPPYNPWRRGGTCLVKDIEKDGVFQAPEFVPACETVVELGKFSVGTSSVFSYCDPTPPLPSPPYNPWRRGGTCLVKDIEKDGVFQAPEFVPACETVVELGKFSVGTSSVFSYCDPTPPLPSPPYNPWRRGGTCLVKDIEKDGVFQAPEFVPACETVVELGKFSVGTSSVFSYCDPTPPLPSPPYNPWRRGGTCLVKDIEKDGVFQAPEFVPACETVVELGKFSVGTSSVFSYCDPTPPLPSPPYNPWRRGGTCLVKDIEKDGVFQAPEFVPACETVVELGKFSVGTSSVFSYCDPTPPLPSPPYNPWRRGGTCLVKDIEKDGVFQAPEFVPACETVVELGKFSVGTSSVFSYCDPTPPLPSPPYNPWRRGGTCLVKDIEKDGVFQAPEFVPACETVVELGKFSVGTSSVFSYCDPTPPLPSPPYNPWRRGGTCLVKDIEKDGVFQAPEFVPACETVVELGKFSVGTSSVFSYCDPTPPLPSPPYNPWRRGGTCLVKDIEKDGVFQAPEFVPACETVVELGHSGKWPGEIEAFRCLKAAFNLQIADRLSKQFDLSTHAYPTHIDVLKNGLVFRLVIAHPKEITLLRRQVEHGVVKFKESEESIKLQRDTVLLPRLRGALHGLHQRHPSFGVASCLLQRFISSHLLAPHFPPTISSLLTAKVYSSPAPHTAPVVPQVGFLRSLKLLSETNWASEMLLIDFNGDMKREDILEIETKFSQRDGSTPYMYIVTSYDGDLPSVWTSEAPTKHTVLRAQALARNTLTFMENKLMKDMLDNVLSAFVPSYAGYDVLLHLLPALTPYLSERVDVKPTPRALPDDTSDVIPVVGFNPVQRYLDELRSAYSEFALFFHDYYGGEVIAVLWKPDIGEHKEFQVANASALRPTGKGDKYKVNKAAIVEDFKILGAGLVKHITVT